MSENDAKQLDHAARPQRPQHRSRERRTIVMINVGLLVVAALVAAPRVVQAVVSGLREERECATVRSVLAANDVRAIEQAQQLDADDDKGFAALEKLSQALEKASFDALAVRAITTTSHAVLDARQKLVDVEQKVASAKKASQAVERQTSQALPGKLERLRSLARLCATDPSAGKDCVAISELPGLSMSSTNSREEVMRRLGEFEAQHKAKVALALTHPQVKAIIEEELKQEAEFIALTRDMLRKLDVVDQDKTDESAARHKMRTSHRAFQQQLAGVRIYCDAPLNAKDEVRR